MKLNKILLTAAAVCALAQAASAQTVNIYLTGSTAFRSAVYTTIRSLYTAGFAENTDGGASPNKANHMTWSGSMSSVNGGAGTVNVFAYFGGGSVEGIQALTQNQNQPYFASAVQGNTNIVSIPADFSLSDVFQASTPFTSPALTDTKVGVVPFTFVRNVNAASAGITNITDQQAISLLGNGVMSLRYFSGNAADQGTSVYLVGRYNLSGSRLSVQADVGYGGLSSSSLYGLVSGVWTSLGDNGYSSGGSVANDLKNNSNNGPAIGYVGVSDAGTAIGGGAAAIPYEGQLLTFDANGATLIYEGKYSLWGYEHLMNKTGLDTPHTQFKTALIAAIPAVLIPGSAGLPLANMQVIRFSDGGAIGTLY